MNGDEKQERMMAMQGRVDLVAMADLLRYFKRQDFTVNSMSMLLALAVDTAHWACKQAGYLEDGDLHKGVSDANRTFEHYGIWSQSMKKRNQKKLNAAMAFENLRAEGVEPADYVPRQHNILHNSHSVKTQGIRSKADEAVAMYKKLEKEKMLKDSERSTGLTMEELEKLKNPNYDPEVARVQQEEFRAREKKAEELIRKEKLKIARRETAQKQLDAVKDIVEEPGSAASMTSEEFAAEEARIAQKDADLLSQMDSCPMPDQDK